jgi:outer membrane beta-barrel protein
MPIAAHAEDADFDSLGGNQPIYERAKAISSEKTVSIVQNRMVSRVKRIELAPEISGTFGGDSYNRTKSLGLNAHYHFNPRWSVGARYEYAFNTLTPEGKAMVADAIADFNNNPGNPSVPYPAIDYPKSQMLAFVNWYPFYGKLNLLDKAIAHFDIYGILGGGQVELSSGATTTYTGGLGVGFWINQHLTSRMEMRYQTYSTKSFDETKKLDLAVTSLQVGYLL